MKLLIEAEAHSNIDDTKLIELLHNDYMQILLWKRYGLIKLSLDSIESDKYVFTSGENSQVHGVWRDVVYYYITHKGPKYHIMRPQNILFWLGDSRDLSAPTSYINKKNMADNKSWKNDPSYNYINMHRQWSDNEMHS